MKNMVEMENSSKRHIDIVRINLLFHDCRLLKLNYDTVILMSDMHDYVH